MNENPDSGFWATEEHTPILLSRSWPRAVIPAAVRRFERELIREPITAGMAQAKKQGKPLGRPKKVFDRDELVRMRRQGQSIKKIARRMRLGAGTVVRAL